MICEMIRPIKIESIRDAEVRVKLKGVELIALVLALGKVNDDEVIKAYEDRGYNVSYRKYFKENLNSFKLYHDLQEEVTLILESNSWVKGDSQ